MTRNQKRGKQKRDNGKRERHYVFRGKQKNNQQKLLISLKVEKYYYLEQGRLFEGDKTRLILNFKKRSGPKKLTSMKSSVRKVESFQWKAGWCSSH